MGFRQIGRDQQGRPRMEAPISKVLSGVAQGRMRQLLGGQLSDAMAFIPQHSRPLALQPAKAKRKRSEPEEQPKRRKSGIKALPKKKRKTSGKVAANGIIDWLNENGYGGDSNYTVGVDKDDDLIISKVNGVTEDADAMVALGPIIVQKEWNLERRIFLAQKFNTAVGSNHAEMCVLAASGRDTLAYMKCTNPNCDFCKAALKTYNVPSGNGGGGKSQQGWAHPFYPIFYGTQIGALAPQVEELKGLGQNPTQAEIELGRWGLSAPKGQQWTEWKFS